jgi:hypothetical protein
LPVGGRNPGGRKAEWRLNQPEASLAEALTTLRAGHGGEEYFAA